MKKLLVAITCHNPRRSAVWKTWQSVRGIADKILFCYDRVPDIRVGPYVITGEETLGGKRNAAIDYARANNYRMIAFLDDDDLFGPSWMKSLLALEPEKNTIYHPQWNVLFSPQIYKLHEHIADNDSRFDSRDAINFNPWSALCAFDVHDINIRYRKHQQSDKRESFEDWSFNLDTYCEGIAHRVLPDTFHFLRLRLSSLGKSTHTCGPAHSKYFLSADIRNKKIATEDYLQLKYQISDELLKNEMKAIHEIDPQLYFWGQEGCEQEQYGRCSALSEAIEKTNISAAIKDVLWTFDAERSGGAEKALGFVRRFFMRFPTGEAAAQESINDAKAKKEGIAWPSWIGGWANTLKAWQDAPNSKARSLHICNSMGWDAVCRNPEIFNKVQVYFYVFNDDLRFSDESMDITTRGYHSPLYRYCEHVDRPNFHIITDSNHFAQRIHEKTGLGDKIRVIDIPVIPQECKRKDKPTKKVDILWSGRLDHNKGIEMLVEASKLLPKNYMVHVWGGGDDKWTKMIFISDRIFYNGIYKSFEMIDGKYDFAWFTSEREGMPNVIKEYVAADLPILSRYGEWSKELPVARFYSENATAEEIAKEIQNFDAQPVDSDQFSFDKALPRAMFAFKEALI